MNEIITKKQFDYTCPKCGSEHIYCCESDEDEEWANYQWACNDCQCGFTVVYKFEVVEYMDEEEE